MKQILILSSVLFLASCIGPQEKKQYDFEIIYTNGDTLETSYQGVGTNLFSLKNGDLTTNGQRTTLVSGVRSYRVVSIKSLGMQTEKEADANGCGCTVNPVTQISND
jgi:hypothetical protein